MQRVLIIGATSTIATEVARLLLRRGSTLALVARDAARLDALSVALRDVGPGRVAHCAVLEANDLGRHQAVLDAAAAALGGGFDAVLLAHGVLGEQRDCETDVAAMVSLVDTNATSVMALCTLLAPRLAAQGHGTLAVIGSVAGDRGKPNNYVYGAAKAAVSVYLQGLRARWFRDGVRIVTIKPGFVDTPMTARYEKNLLFARPESVARGVVRAMERGTPVVYLPRWWRWIMLAVRLVPERLFQRLSLAPRVRATPSTPAASATRPAPRDG